ncbi:MAG: hypothetical protein GX977_13390, partial [Firmicutes bacterium]|nr:hypothetical protein [Bacillota bacterium]
TSGPAAIQGGRTILEGGDGGLGTAEAPLTLALKPDAELTARAAKDIHIHETVGNLNLAEVFGRGNIVLQAKESILDSRGERSIAIMGNGVNLTAEEGSIGTEANPVYLTVNPSGQLTAYALKGDVYLATPSTNLVNLSDILAGGTLAIAAAGQLSIHGRLAAVDALSISSNGTLQVESSGRLDSSGRLTLMGEEVLMAEGSSGKSADGIDITAANGVEVSQLEADNDVQLTAGTTISQAGNGSITAQTLRTSSGGRQILDGANQITSFAAATTGGGSIKLSNMSALSITGITQAVGGNIEITNAGDLQISGTVSTGDQVELNVAGRIVEGTAGEVHAERLVTSSVGGQVLLGDNRIRSFQASNQGDDIQLNNNGYDLEVISINQADGGDIALTNNEGGITITGLVRTRDGAHLTAQGTIEQAGDGRIEEAASLTIAGTGGQKLLGANTVHGFQGTNVGGGKVELNNAALSLEVIQLVQADGGDIELTNVGDLAISGQISSAAGDISVVADGTIHSTHGDVSIRGTDIRLEAKEGGIGSKETRIVAIADGCTNLSAGLDIFFEERETDLDSDFVISEHGSVDLLVPAGGIHVDELRAAGLITVRTPRSVSLGSTAASQLNLYVSGRKAGVSIAEALISETLTVSADQIEFANLIHTGVGPLKVRMGGGSKRMADSITVSGSSSVGMVFEHLESDTMLIEADTEDLKLTEVVLGTNAQFSNRYHTVIADNVNKQLFFCDLQLYPERDPFYLTMGRDRLIRTDAWVVHYNDDYIINDFATENSFMRITSKMPQIVGFGLLQNSGFSSSTLGRDGATSSSGIIISSGIYDSLQPGSSSHADDDEE